MKKEPTRTQKRQFKKGFFWGRIEHRLETYTTYTLLIGILFLVGALIINERLCAYIATGFFVMALIFRFFAGISHRLEKHYMDKLRFGRWR